MEISEEEYNIISYDAYHDLLTGCYNKNWLLRFCSLSIKNFADMRILSNAKNSMIMNIFSSARSFISKEFFDNFELYGNMKASDCMKALLVYFDINDLKQLNDKNGHCSGDKYIYSVATEIRKFGGLAIRDGGDEFLLMLSYDFPEEKLSLFKDSRYSFGYFYKDETISFENAKMIIDCAMYEQKALKHKNKIV